MIPSSCICALQFLSLENSSAHNKVHARTFAYLLTMRALASLIAPEPAVARVSTIIIYHPWLQRARRLVVSRSHVNTCADCN